MENNVADTPKDDNQELKDMMMGNVIEGILGNGIEEKLPMLLEKFAPKAYDGIKKYLGEDKVRWMILNDPTYGLVLQRLNMDHEETKIQFPEPNVEDIIIIQQKENGLSVLLDGKDNTVAELLKVIMTSVGGKLF